MSFVAALCLSNVFGDNYLSAAQVAARDRAAADSLSSTLKSGIPAKVGAFAVEDFSLFRVSGIDHPPSMAWLLAAVPTTGTNATSLPPQARSSLQRRHQLSAVLGYGRPSQVCSTNVGQLFDTAMCLVIHDGTRLRTAVKNVAAVARSGGGPRLTVGRTAISQTSFVFVGVEFIGSARAHCHARAIATLLDASQIGEPIRNVPGLSKPRVIRMTGLGRSIAGVLVNRVRVDEGKEAVDVIQEVVRSAADATARQADLAYRFSTDRNQAGLGPLVDDSAVEEVARARGVSELQAALVVVAGGQVAREEIKPRGFGDG